MEQARPTILCLDPRAPDPAAIKKAASALKNGDLVILPTETVYGVAADPRVAGAVDRIYRVKGRADDKPIALFAAELRQVEQYGARVSPKAARLAQEFWPGPLTLVLPCASGFVGFRVPDHPVPLAVLRCAGFVLAVTSANRSGDPPSITAQEAAAALGSRVSIVLDAGPSPGGVPSTVVKVDGEKLEILREGAIGRGEIERISEGKL